VLLPAFASLSATIMSSFIFGTRTFTSTRVIQAPAADAIRAIQDPEVFLRLNSAVVAIRQDEKEPERWHLTERLTFLGITSTITPSVKFRNIGQTMELEAEAPGLTAKGTWTVRQLDDGSCEIKEETVINAPWITMGYVAKQLSESRGRIFTVLAAKLESERAA